MKIGVIGIGGIAQKAYLPTYARYQGTVDFSFATRNKETQQKLRTSYGFEQVYDHLEDLLAQKIDACMIHAATTVHYQLAKQCLEHGVHVFIDKPLSTEVQEVEELKALAEDKGLLLMIGFNRRFAPMTDRLKQVPDKRLIHVQKNRIDAKEESAFVVFDLFLHIVDTAVYLLDEPIRQVKSKIREKDGLLQLAMMELETENSLALITMDLHSGANTETYQITSPSGTYTLDNLTELTVREPEGQKVTIGFDDWSDTLAKRGFVPMVLSFFAALSGKEADLRQEEVLLSHQLCDQLLRQHTRHSL